MNLKLRFGWLLILLVLPIAGFATVQQQLDTLIAAAQGKRIGMITNPSGCDEAGNLDANYVIAASGTTVTAFFAPEHGLRGTLPPGVGGGDYIDPDTGIPVYAVYGIRNAPTNAQLATVDLLVFDMQDVGVRFYTFVWTMTHCMEAAAANNKPFYIIDRPNPIGGLVVDGRPNTANHGLIGRLGTGASFCVATRHGMTAAEIGWMWNEEYSPAEVELHPVLMTDWTRDQWWSDTGRTFVAPSPNMRTPATATVYPGTCIFEGSNLSEGRGTAIPFEVIGAPFINSQTWVNALTALNLPGVQFIPASFTPTTSKWSGQACNGVQVIVTDTESFEPVRTGMHMLRAVYLLYPGNVTITSYAASLTGIPNLHNRIKTETVEVLAAEWEPLLTQFLAVRQQYLLYGNAAGIQEWARY